MVEPAPAPHASPEFTLDTEKAAAAVRALEAVMDRLASMRFDAVQVGKQAAAHPDVLDAVSIEAFDLLSLKADGGPGSLTAAIDEGLHYTDLLIKQMKADIREQKQLDEDSDMGDRA